METEDFYSSEPDDYCRRRASYFANCCWQGPPKIDTDLRGYKQDLFNLNPGGFGPKNKAQGNKESEQEDVSLELFDTLYEQAKARDSSTELTDEEREAISNIYQPIQYE